MRPNQEMLSSGVAKQAVRERIWSRLERERVARFPGARGRIPNFVGAELAAERLAALPEWSEARVLKANPDAPQLPVRARALAEGKLVYMAVPRLADPFPFLLLDPASLSLSPRRAASIRGAAAAGVGIALSDMEPIDLIVCGSVAVNLKGVRVGKGGGFSDLEFALGTEAGLITEATIVATTIHPLQLVDGELPETEHDFSVDLIVTPDEILRCPDRKRPPGIIWGHLEEEKTSAIPALAARLRQGATGPPTS
jgi:5-formyltetrahydrofolate cyclo-ligase